MSSDSEDLEVDFPHHLPNQPHEVPTDLPQEPNPPADTPAEESQEPETPADIPVEGPGEAGGTTRTMPPLSCSSRRCRATTGSR